ncbi:MAG: hypothetical protein H7Z21_08840 [Hymenobacter sp.]|nr:hypothetical protein [Hymenobacter sp.]
MKKVLFTAALSAFLLGTVAPAIAQTTPTATPMQGDTTKVKANARKGKMKTEDGKAKMNGKKGKGKTKMDKPSE